MTSPDGKLSEGQVKAELAGLAAGRNGDRPAKDATGQAQGARYGIAHSSPDPGLWAERPPEGPGGRAWPLTDWGNAQRLVFYWGNALRYCHLWRKWLVWDGCRWCVDDTAGASRLAKDTARRIFHEAAEVAPTDDSPAAEQQTEAQRKAIVAWALKTQAGGRLKAMLELAASEPGVPVLPGELDRDPWALNVRNGTIDLRTGQLRPHRRADLLTKLAPVDYQPDAPCPTWERFLARVMNGDQELAGFLRRAVGYSCTGDVSEEILFLLHGVGANGKSKFLETVQAALGQYAQEAPGDLLLSKRRGGVPNDVARLMGARFVASIETGEGESLDEGLVKHLTGGDTITARYLYGEFFEFAPTHKLWLSTNHKPSVLGTDEGIWRRIMLVPFTAYIPPQERDKRLLDKLRAELAGVLAWIVRGAVEWQRVGLRPPAKVTEATAAYRAAQDDLGAWIAQRCLREDGAEEAFKALYDSYTAWAEAGRLTPLNSRQFGDSLTERGFPGFRKSGTYAFRTGMRLRRDPAVVGPAEARLPAETGGWAHEPTGGGNPSSDGLTCGNRPRSDDPSDDQEGSSDGLTCGNSARSDDPTRCKEVPTRVGQMTKVCETSSDRRIGHSPAPPDGVNPQVNGPRGPSDEVRRTIRRAFSSSDSSDEAPKPTTDGGEPPSFPEGRGEARQGPPPPAPSSAAPTPPERASAAGVSLRAIAKAAGITPSNPAPPDLAARARQLVDTIGAAAGGSPQDHADAQRLATQAPDLAAYRRTIALGGAQEPAPTPDEPSLARGQDSDHAALADALDALEQAGLEPEFVEILPNDDLRLRPQRTASTQPWLNPRRSYRGKPLTGSLDDFRTALDLLERDTCASESDCCVPGGGERCRRHTRRSERRPGAAA